MAGRAPRTTLGTSSLGAVGGARGTAAGALRILVEFITQYDAAALKQLQSDLQSLESQEQALVNQEIALTKQRDRARELAASREETLLKRILQLRGQAARDAKGELKRAQELFKVGDDKNAKETLRNLALNLGLTQRQATLAANIITQKRRELRLNQQLTQIERTRAAVAEQRAGTEAGISRLQGIAGAIPGRLGGLALGAIGGVFGGAIFGVAFAAADQLFKIVEESILNLVDPARKAREELEGVAKAVTEIANEKNISNLEAAKELLQSLALPAGADEAGALAQAVETQKLIEAVEKRLGISRVVQHSAALEEEALKKLTEQITESARAQGQAVIATREYDERTKEMGRTLTFTIDGVDVATVTWEEYRNILQASVTAINAAATAQIRLAGATQLAAYAQDRFNAALNSVVNAKLAPIQAQIEGLQATDYESARTRNLQQQLENAQAAGGGSSQAAALRSIEEERQLILLRQRLRLLGTNINLERYSGKFLLEAINAKIAALQREGQEQDRLNKLLNLQYRMSKQLRRQEGESISDFLERRAQENRELLSEQRELERERVIQSLEDQKEKVQDEVALAELAERKKQQIASAGSSARIKNLQKELAESQRADREYIQGKIKALQEIIERERAKAAEAIRIASVEEQTKIRVAISGINSTTDLYRIAGAIQGTQAALGFIKAFGAALVATGALTQRELNSIISRLNNTLAAYTRQKANYSSNAYRELAQYSNFHGLASGGVVMLNNGMNPFGQNIRVGEQGTEIGVVLSNKVTKALRDSTGIGQVGPFNLYGSQDTLRDKYTLQRTVEDAIARALR